MNIRRFGLATAVAAMMAATALTAPVAAQDDGEASIIVPIQETYATGQAGDTVEVGSAEVPADLVGRPCTVNATVVNNQSTHVGNTMIIASGDSSVSISGIEDATDATMTGAGTLTLGSTVTASVVLGADGATSVGSSVTVSCDPLPVTPPPAPVTKEPNYTG